MKWSVRIASTRLPLHISRPILYPQKKLGPITDRQFDRIFRSRWVHSSARFSLVPDWPVCFSSFSYFVWEATGSDSCLDSVSVATTVALHASHCEDPSPFLWNSSISVLVSVPNMNGKNPTWRDSDAHRRQKALSLCSSALTIASLCRLEQSKSQPTPSTTGLLVLRPILSAFPLLPLFSLSFWRVRIFLPAFVRLTEFPPLVGCLAVQWKKGRRTRCDNQTNRGKRDGKHQGPHRAFKWNYPFQLYRWKDS